MAGSQVVQMKERSTQKVSDCRLEARARRLSTGFLSFDCFTELRNERAKNALTDLTPSVCDARNAVSINAEVAAQKRGNKVSACPFDQGLLRIRHGYLAAC